MIVMPSQNGTAVIHYWAGKGYPIGWLFTPGGAVREPVEWMPYAIDNGMFAVWDKGLDWNEQSFLKILELYSAHPLKPLWAVVPDSVGDRDETLREWDRWYPQLSRSFDLRYAFAAQDGMTAKDVPSEADVVFVGGTFKWKWRNLKTWCKDFPRIHVGRVNTIRTLLYCMSLGVESVDGTGWFRSPHRTDQLHKFFKMQSGEEPLHDQMELGILDEGNER